MGNWRHLSVGGGVGWRIRRCGSFNPAYFHLTKPTDNAFIEAFNSKFRSECLNAHWFMSLDDAQSKMEDWRKYYNEERPHSGIGHKVPILLHNSGGVSSPSLAKEAENSSLS